MTIETPFLTNDVPAIWRRWEARFVSTGLDFNVLLKLKKEITDWSVWCERFSAEAADREAFGDAAMLRGHTLTAAEAWSQASILYHYGGMYFISDMSQFWHAHRASVSAFAKAAPYLYPPAERMDVDFKGVKIAGYLRKPAGVHRPPVVIGISGFEGSKEAGQHRNEELLERGIANFSFDGPGRGESWEQLPMTGDYGPIVSAIIDALEKRGDVDARHIGVTGPNRGAFLAAKAAAHDPRIKAAALASPGYARRETKWDDPCQVAFDMHLFHLKTPEELRERLEGPDLTLEGEAQNIKCPVLMIAGGRDDKGHFDGSRRLYDEMQGEKHWVVFPDSERNGNNVPFKVRPIIADFLAEKLNGKLGGCHN
jgi:2,6-dihydroxypseudooxynicotine hydrolase